MVRLYHTDGKDYHYEKNKNNSVTLFETDTSLPLLTITTDYKAIEIPTCNLIGRIDCQGQYLVFKPMSGKVLRSQHLTATPDNIVRFHRDIFTWWLSNNLIGDYV